MPRFFRRKRSLKKKKTFATRVKQVVGRRQEQKYWDVAASDVLSDVGAIGKFTSVSQGDTASTRDGNVIYFQSLRITFRVLSNLAATIASDNYSANPVCRIIVFQYKPNDGTAPVIGNLLANANTPVNLISPYNQLYKQQFKILYDKRFVLRSPGLQQTSGTDDGVIPTQMSWSILIPGRKCNRKMTYATTATTGTNQIYYCFLSDMEDTADEPTAYFYSRLLYTDS